MARAQIIKAENGKYIVCDAQGRRLEPSTIVRLCTDNGYWMNTTARLIAWFMNNGRPTGHRLAPFDDVLLDCVSPSTDFKPPGPPPIAFWNPKGRPAFTLVELLIVIAIIGIIIGLVLSTIAGIRNEARRSRCGSNERQIWLAVEDYMGTCRIYPGPGQIQLPDAAFICPAWWKDPDAEFQMGSYTWTFYHDRWGNPLTVGALDAAGLPARLPLTGDSQPRHSKHYQYVFLDGSIRLLTEQP